MRAALLLLLAAGADAGAPGPGAILVVAALLGGSAFFSGAETAVVSARRARLERAAGDGRRDARAALALLADTPRTIATTLVGTNICNIGAASLATGIAVAVWGERGPTIATLVMTPVVLFGAEILPKALFRSRATRLLRGSAGVLHTAVVLFRPIVAVTSWATGVLLFLLRVPRADRGPHFARTDLENLFLFGRARGDESEAGGTQAAFRMAGQVLELQRRSVEEAAVPLHPDRTCGHQGTVGDARERFRAAGGGILAVLDARGGVAGFVAAKDLLGVPPDRPLAPHVRPAYVLRPEDTVDQAITGFRRSRLRMGVVRRGDGSTIGVLAPEDVLEEIVGELGAGGLSGSEPKD
jgi:putative hemolysin